MRKCKYCTKEATMKSYRDNNGVVSSEIVCTDCHERKNPRDKFLDDIVKIEIISRYPYNEGDDYYTLERLDNGKVNIIWSCWDDQSEEIYDEEYDEQGIPPLYFDSVDTVRTYCNHTGLHINQVYDHE